VAVDALGRERVRAVMLPSTFNATVSLEDAARWQASSACYDEIPIDGSCRRFARRSRPNSRASPKTTPKRISRHGSEARC
jgi:hypothetical protein